MAKGKKTDTHTLDLFETIRPTESATASYDWPNADRFPINVHGKTVRGTVVADLLDSGTPLVVTGYTSLDHVIDLIAKCRKDASIRVMFGNEPFQSHREKFVVGGAKFTAEMEQFWLEKGISLRRSVQLIECIEALEQGRVETRYLQDAG